jgi:hypothetical protein
VWHRSGPRPGWDALLTAARAGNFHHLIIDEPEELFRRHPGAFATFLAVVDEQGLVLHTPAGPWDLNDLAVLRALREQADEADRASQWVSQAVRSAHEDAAAAGRPHGGGRRAYGYQAGTHVLVESEAAVVREIFARFLAGESLRGIGWDLNSRDIPTAYGGRWSPDKIARVIAAPRYAGLRVFRGEIARASDGTYLMGAWEPCVTVAEWEKARAQRLSRAEVDAAGRRPDRAYLLTGLVWCMRCDRHMVGTMVGTYPMYACTDSSRLTPDRCTRHIAAERLETYIEDHVIRVLLRWDDRSVDSAPVAVTTRTPTPHTGRDVPQHDGPGPARPRNHTADQAVVVRRTDALDGVVTGQGARFAWDRLSYHRKAAVLRFVLAAIRVGASSTPRNVFDYSRVEIVPHAL